MVMFLVSRACGQGPVFRVCFHVLTPQLSLQPWLSRNLTSENSPKYCPWVRASFQGRRRAVPAHKDRTQEGGGCVPEAPRQPHSQAGDDLQNVLGSREELVRVPGSVITCGHPVTLRAKRASVYVEATGFPVWDGASPGTVPWEPTGCSRSLLRFWLTM